MEINLYSKLNYCLRNSIIPFLSEQQENILIITVDIMKELKSNQNIENLTALKDVGLLLGFKYVNKTVNGRKARILEGTTEKFIKFIEAKIT
jgi:hypothetical protein